MSLLRSKADLDFQVAELPPTPQPNRVLLADPEHYDITYAINPYMAYPSGSLRTVDRAKALEQWRQLRKTFSDLGFIVDTVPALAGHPDLVFCANQAIPIPAVLTGGSNEVVPSRMARTERAGEVAHVVNTLTRLGYEARPLSSRTPHEGMGDALWQPGRQLLWTGVGSRSGDEAWYELAQRYRVRAVRLELCDPDFYHLDTCFCPLDDRTCLWVPHALTPDSRTLIEALLPLRIKVDTQEARCLLAANVCPVGAGKVLLERECVKTAAQLQRSGFEPIPVSTSEFIKGGGSVFCMKMLHGPLE